MLQDKPIGICPACGETVSRDEDEVWTCPRDLSPANPYREPSDVTEDQMQQDQVFSLCYENHGGFCSDHMPLHAACYDRGDY
jgi:predicted amidophosphoribosyltransferase